jgi:hypothetical protein
MGNKIILDDKLIQLIKDQYISGIGSTIISKNLNIPKHTILKILNKLKIIRNRRISKEFYSNFWEEENMWCGNYVCKSCNEKIKFCVNEKSLLNRNLKRKNICKKCSLKKQIGSSNSFYGKKHMEKTKKQISNKKIGICTSNHSKKPEYRKLYSKLAKERWASGKMESTRIKLSNLMKSRIMNGKLKGYIRSKAELKIVDEIQNLGIIVIENFKIKTKVFDIYIPKFNLLIEYNGDYWHCNPKKYSPNYFNSKKNKTAEEIWNYDKNKLDLAKKYNYTCETIWESDYKKDPEIIKNIIKKYDTKHD